MVISQTELLNMSNMSGGMPLQDAGEVERKGLHYKTVVRPAMLYEAEEITKG